MKNKLALTLIALGLTLPAIHLNAQDDPRPPRGPRADGQRPLPPLVAALDLNHDGVIDASELAAATESLRKLDKNGDGKLTPEELRPTGRPAADADQPDHPRPPRRDEPGVDGKAGPGGGRPPGPPIVAALDTNQDGVIDATELSNAPAALKALDKNGDGELTAEELRPRGPRGARGPGREQDGSRPPRRPQPAE